MGSTPILNVITQLLQMLTLELELAEQLLDLLSASKPWQLVRRRKVRLRHSGGKTAPMALVTGHLQQLAAVLDQNFGTVLLLTGSFLNCAKSASTSAFKIKILL